MARPALRDVSTALVALLIIAANVVFVLSILFAYHPSHAVISNVIPPLAPAERACARVIDSLFLLGSNVDHPDLALRAYNPERVDAFLDGFLYAFRNCACSAWSVFDLALSTFRLLAWIYRLLAFPFSLLAVPHNAMVQTASSVFGSTVGYIRSGAKEYATSSPAHWQHSALQTQRTPPSSPGVSGVDGTAGTTAASNNEQHSPHVATLSYAKYHIKKADVLSMQCEFETVTVNHMHEVDKLVYATDERDMHERTLTVLITDAIPFDHAVPTTSAIDIYDVATRTMRAQRSRAWGGDDKSARGFSVVIVSQQQQQQQRRHSAAPGGVEEDPMEMLLVRNARSSGGTTFAPATVLSIVHVQGDFDVVSGNLLPDVVGVSTWHSRNELHLSLLSKFHDPAWMAVGERGRINLVVDMVSDADLARKMHASLPRMRQDIWSAVSQHAAAQRAQTLLPESLTSVEHKSGTTASTTKSVDAFTEQSLLSPTIVMDGTRAVQHRQSAHIAAYAARASWACGDDGGAVNPAAAAPTGSCLVAEVGRRELALSLVSSPLLAYTSVVAYDGGTRSLLDAGFHNLSMSLDNAQWDSAIQNDYMFACWYNLFYTSLSMELDAGSATERALDMYKHFDRACSARAPSSSPPPPLQRSPFLNIDFINPHDAETPTHTLVVASHDETVTSAQIWMSTMAASLFPPATTLQPTGETGALPLKQQRDPHAESANGLIWSSQRLGDDEVRGIGLHMLKSCRVKDRPKVGKSTENASEMRLIEEVFGRADEAERQASSGPVLPRPYESRRMDFGACITGAHALAWHRYWTSYSNTLVNARRLDLVRRCSTPSRREGAQETTGFTFYRRGLRDAWLVRDGEASRNGDADSEATVLTRLKSMITPSSATTAPSTGSSHRALYEVVVDEEQQETMITSAATPLVAGAREERRACLTEARSVPQTTLLATNEAFGWWRRQQSPRSGYRPPRDAGHSASDMLLKGNLGGGDVESDGGIFLAPTQLNIYRHCVDSATVISGRSLQLPYDCVFDVRTKAYVTHTLASLED